MKKNIIAIIIGIIIILIGAYFNFSGWQWSLPNDTHYYTYHPDEGINIGGAIRIFAGAKDPGFFNYSSLYFYIVAYVMSVASTLGVLNLGETMNSGTLAQLYSCGRITSLIFSILTIGLIYWTGYRFKGLWCGIFAGLIACFTPIFVMHSKFIAVDVTCGFFVALTLFIASFIDLNKIDGKMSPPLTPPDAVGGGLSNHPYGVKNEQPFPPTASGGIKGGDNKADKAGNNHSACPPYGVAHIPEDKKLSSGNPMGTHPPKGWGVDNKTSNLWKNATFKKHFLIPLILSSIASGLAMGTKYNGIIVFIVPLMILIYALCLKKINIKNFILSLIITGACALITFLITTPGIFINNAQFIKDFSYELHHMKIGHGDEFVNTGIGFIYTIRENMFYGMGLFYTIFAILSLIVALISNSHYAKALSIFAIIYYISISTGNVRFARYLIPVLPVFAILTAYSLNLLITKHKIFKLISPILLLLILVPNIISSIHYNKCFTTEDTRDIAIKYCNANLKGETIGLPTVPWFFTPPFNKETSVMRQQRYEFTIENKDFNLLCQPEEKNEWNVEFLKENKPKYVMFSSIESFHKMRTHNKKYEEYMKYIDENYKLYSTFNKSLLYRFKPTEKKYLPSDMTYLQPTIYIYKVNN